MSDRRHPSQRVLDWLIALPAFVLLLPLGAAVALWIKLDSPGPVFFRQTRVGQDGRLFRIHKFRTMQWQPDDAGPQITAAGDARVTRAGAWLRSSKVDELPQLLDVLAGTMSLVGPRPEVPRYLPHYPPALRDKLLSVRPGITDPASLAFADEAERLARSPDPEAEYVGTILPAKLAASAAYIDQRHALSDLGVIAATVSRVLLRRETRSSVGPETGSSP